ncbi:hypothetical protein L1F30_13665 [Simiduia sp. 21SJ11W-1]|uniref:hypothetical protein n=1 Tax=Simiduia sp. 21SJ11W-1 TaxID=2909669 RepID=UPI00209D50B5|nr:hypothetical protein [Simiduia sp. 21SJ11W-1]UTA47204.1 hypothetical protein L1F30_13665 [Simiduia sp. 21SJ11W-1]
MAYWRRAMQLAQASRLKGEYERAAAAYACAFDIARLRLADSEQGLLSGFGPAQLVAVVLQWLHLVASPLGPRHKKIAHNAEPMMAAVAAFWFCRRFLLSALKQPTTCGLAQDIQNNLTALDAHLHWLQDYSTHEHEHSRLH